MREPAFRGHAHRIDQPLVRWFQAVRNAAPEWLANANTAEPSVRLE
jgi:hypothetical protein